MPGRAAWPQTNWMQEGGPSGLKIRRGAIENRAQVKNLPYKKSWQAAKIQPQPIGCGKADQAD